MNPEQHLDEPRPRNPERDREIAADDADRWYDDRREREHEKAEQSDRWFCYVERHFNLPRGFLRRAMKLNPRLLT